MKCEICDKDGIERVNIQSKSILCNEHFLLRKKLESDRDDYFKVRHRVATRPRSNHIRNRRTRNETRIAIEKGLIKIKDCEVCGEKEDVQTHHLDYTNPLNVLFLCRKHHLEWHRKNGNV